MQRIAILGGGRMGEALLAGLLDAGYSPDALAVAEAYAERRMELEARAPGTRIGPSAAWAVADADVVVVAVKPGDVADVLESAIDALPAHACIVSIAAGVTIADLEALAPGRPVVRAMPNTPALVGRGATAIAAGSLATDDDLASAERLLSHVGTVARVPEHLLDPVTGLSGSGPAYVFLVVEALTEAGVLNGLPRDLAVDLVAQTLIGSAELLLASEDGPEVLRANVTSPGGTTAAGLAALERNGVRAAFLEAVTAATERSRELGRRS